jgi:hypothetical protein
VSENEQTPDEIYQNFWDTDLKHKAKRAVDAFLPLEVIESHDEAILEIIEEVARDAYEEGHDDGRAGV